MVSPTPVWLLDIDGVITPYSNESPTNIWPRSQWIQDVWAYSEAQNQSYDVHAARPVLDFINEVHRLGLAEIRWHTTWQESATNVSRVLGLPEFPIQPAPEFFKDAWKSGIAIDGVWWKVPPILRAIEEDPRPYIWTDDHLFRDTTRTQRQLMRATVPFLMVTPHSESGLARHHLQEIREFLETYQ